MGHTQHIIIGQMGESTKKTGNKRQVKKKKLGGSPKRQMKKIIEGVACGQPLNAVSKSNKMSSESQH